MAPDPNAGTPRVIHKIKRIPQKGDRRKRNRGADAKQKQLGMSIRTARRAINFTQQQLGTRLGVKGRTVHRWENNLAAPTPRHEREMLAVVGTYSSEAAAVLRAAFDAARGKADPKVPVTVAAEPATPPTRTSDAFELAVFGLADDLDLPPRRVRRPLVRLLERLQAAQFTIDSAKQQLAAWVEEQRY